MCFFFFSDTAPAVIYTLSLHDALPIWKTIFELGDVVVDSCVPLTDASVPLKNHFDRIGPVSTMGFITLVWMTVTTVAEILADRGVHLYIHPSHNVPGDTTARQRLDAALAEYKSRVKVL